MPSRSAFPLLLALAACNPSCGVDDLTYVEEGGGGGDGGFGGFGGTGATGGTGGAGGTGATGGAPPARVFVTASLHAANFGGLTEGDEICNDAATISNLGGTWLAWLSDDTTHAIDRIVDRSPWVLIGDFATVAVANMDQLAMVDVDLAAKIDVDNLGASADGQTVWTATNGEGQGLAGHCQNWMVTSAVDSAAVGDTANTDAGWTFAGQLACNTTARLYCFEQ